MKDAKFKSLELLMDESLKEFCEYSYENASLNRIIKSAGVSKGSFYYHFKNKEDLYQHLLTKSVEAKWAFIGEYTSQNAVQFESLDIFDKFLYQAKTGILFAENKPQYNKLAYMFLKEKGTDIYDKMIEVIGGDASDTLRRMVEEAYQAGELDRSFSLDFQFKVIEKHFQDYNDFFDHDDLNQNLQNLEDFVKFLKNGLGAK